MKSIRTTVGLPDDLKKWMVEKAMADGRPLSGWVVHQFRKMQQAELKKELKKKK